MFDDEQLALFDATPYVTPTPYAPLGSQRWIQLAIDRAPHLLLEELQPALRLEADASIQWRSPRSLDGFREYRDRAALRQLGIHWLPHRPLGQFWPEGGPVWDALGKTSGGEYVFVEGKAHLGEIFSSGTRACPASQRLIRHSLREAQEHYLPDTHAYAWDQTGFQYANRLAFHYLFRTLNRLPSHLVFLYFVGDTEMKGPRTARGWHWGIKRLHERLGLPPEFEPPGVHNLFLDIRRLENLI